MTLTISLGDYPDLLLRTTDGETLRLIKDSELKRVSEVVEEMEERLQHLQCRIVTQRELKRRYKVGNQTINDWVTSGLHEIREGNRVYYDLDEVDEIRRRKKI